MYFFNSIKIVSFEILLKQMISNGIKLFSFETSFINAFLNVIKKLQIGML